jgi:hypothetical protein
MSLSVEDTVVHAHVHVHVLEPLEPFQSLLSRVARPSTLYDADRIERSEKRRLYSKTTGHTPIAHAHALSHTSTLVHLCGNTAH